jgi:hypothetical protein
MAKRNQRSKNLEPATMTLNFEIGSTNVQYLSLSKAASVVNRRFYRAGLNWAVGGFRFGYEGSPGLNVLVRALPNTWITGNAHEKAKAMWLKQQNDAVSDTGTQSVVARFRDFKPYMDTIHQGLGGAADLLPTSGGLNVVQTSFLAPDEWVYSTVVIPNDPTSGTTAEYDITVVGPNGSDSRSCLEAYIKSRSVPQSPDPATQAGTPGDWFADMFDVGENIDEVLENAEFDNDQLPYSQLTYPGTSTNGGDLPLHREISFTGTTIGAHQNMDGLNVPCGLLQIVHNGVGLDDNALTMQIMLVPGSHRGYMCEPMSEM